MLSLGGLLLLFPIIFFSFRRNTTQKCWYFTREIQKVLPAPNYVECQNVNIHLSSLNSHTKWTKRGVVHWADHFHLRSHTHNSNWSTWQSNECFLLVHQVTTWKYDTRCMRADMQSTSLGMIYTKYTKGLLVGSDAKMSLWTTWRVWLRPHRGKHRNKTNKNRLEWLSVQLSLTFTWCHGPYLLLW